MTGRTSPTFPLKLGGWHRYR